MHRSSACLGLRCMARRTTRRTTKCAASSSAASSSVARHRSRFLPRSDSRLRRSCDSHVCVWCTAPPRDSAVPCTAAPRRRVASRCASLACAAQCSGWMWTLPRRSCRLTGRRAFIITSSPCPPSSRFAMPLNSCSVLYMGDYATGCCCARQRRAQRTLFALSFCAIAASPSSAVCSSAAILSRAAAASAGLRLSRDPLTLAA